MRAIRRLYLGGVAIFSGPGQWEMAGRLISGMRDMVTAHANEFLRIRAAAVVLDGGAVIFPSPPESHIPALAGLLAQAGAPLLGDEIVNIDPVLRNIHGSDLPLLLDVADLALFPALGREPARRRRKYETNQMWIPRAPVLVEELGGERAGPAPISRIVFPRFEPGETTEFRPMGRSEALYGFVISLLNRHIWADRALILARELLERTPAEQLVIGSLPRAVEMLVGAQAQTVSG